MLTAKVTSKGQITVPKAVREKLGVREGEELLFEEDRGVFRLRKLPARTKFEKWVGFLKSRKNSDEIVEELRGKS